MKTKLWPYVLAYIGFGYIYCFMVKQVYFSSLRENYGLFWPNGRNSGLHEFAFVHNISIIVFHHLHMALSVRHWTIPYAFMFLVSGGLVCLTFITNNKIDDSNLYMGLSNIVESPIMWL
jgi:hypothetical protein